jgi:uncharacterized membrane protein
VRDSLKLIFTIQAATIAAIILDIPIARQIMGFFYTSFIPGFLVLRILGLNPKSRINTVLLSLSLSMAFLMFVGLIVNTLYPLLGISKPLSIIPLSVTIGTALLIMTLLGYRRDDSEHSFSLPPVGHILRIAPLIGVPLLAIFGAMLASSPILLMFVLAVLVLVVVTIFSERIIPAELYAVVILVIAVSFLFHSEFTSQYLQGWDVLGEFYVFRLTSINSLWNPQAIPLPVLPLLDYNAMLSVTILPTIYSNVLNIQGEWVFKFGYLLIYCFVPVSIYQTYKQGFGKSIAFLSAFYFALFPRFYSEERRQIIGELFLVLLIFTILDRNITQRNRKTLLCIFGAALVVSHYSISYIFVFCVLSAWIVVAIIRRLHKNDSGEKQAINTGLVFLILTFNITWYTFASPSVNQTFFEFADHIVTTFTTGFLSVGSRGETVSEFVAPSLGNMTLAYKADYVINKIPYFLIIIGFVALARYYRRMKIQLEYLPMVLSNVSILLLALAVPSFAPAFLAHRFFHVSLLFLAPVCIYGGATLLDWVLKRFVDTERARIASLRAICILLALILLFKTGFVYEVTGDVPISRYIGFTRMKTSDSSTTKAGLYESYIPVQDVYSATWLSRVTSNDSKTYADETASEHVLRAYGLRIIEWKFLLTNETIIQPDAYVYLRYLNTQGVFTEYGKFSNTSVIYNQLDLADKIYSDDSEIYYALPVNH